MCKEEYGRRYRADPVNRERQKERERFRQADPELYKRKRARDLQRLYGIGIEDYERMLVEQGGVCKLCLQPETMIMRGHVKRLVVDHDHETSEVRGLLCHACNTKLGMLIDNSGWLERAVWYTRLLGRPKRLAKELAS